jgi:hypothetical protein
MRVTDHGDYTSQRFEPGEHAQDDRGTKSNGGAKPGAELLPIEWCDSIDYELETNDFVEGLLTEACLAVIYGDSGVGKSFWTIDLFLHVAGGILWNGRECDQGAAIYVALEGGKITKNRIKAAREHLKLSPDIPFALVRCKFDMRTSNVDSLKLINTVKDAAAKFKSQGIPVRAVVIDTMSRALNGGAESAEDMGALLANADMIRLQTGASVCFVAHCGKDAARGIRGWSGIRAAIDVEIEITKSDANPPYTATVTKQRDLQDGDRFGFALKPVELGENQRGRKVNTCIVETDVAAPRSVAAKKLSETNSSFRDHFYGILADYGTTMRPIDGMPVVVGLRRQKLREELVKRGWFTESELLSDGKIAKAGLTRENNALTALERRKILAFSRDAAWGLKR